MNKPWVKENGKEYDEGMRAQAKQKALLYYLVSAYVTYMGYKIISAKLAGDDTLSLPMVSIFSAVLFLGAIFIIVYATKRMFQQFKDSEIQKN